MRSTRASAALLAAAAVLPLSACSPSAPPPAPQPTSTFAWPRVPGRVLTDVVEPKERRVRVRVGDLDAAYAAARDRLEDAGFSLTKDRPAHDGGDGQACTTALCVSFTAVDDPTYGPTVTYEAFHSTGVVG